MYRNYSYREDLKVELTQLEEEDEKERFLEGSKHKRLIPVMLRWKSKKIPVRYLRCCIRSFVGRDTGKMPENFCWKESLKKDFHRRKRKTCSLPDRPGGDRIVSETPRYCPEYGRKAFVSGFETLFTDIRIFFCSGQRQLVR